MRKNIWYKERTLKQQQKNKSLLPLNTALWKPAKNLLNKTRSRAAHIAKKYIFYEVMYTTLNYCR